MTLLNGALWVAGGPLTPDVIAPEITNVTVTNVTSSGMTISFQTSEAATAWVSYTATGACPCVDVYSATTGTTHTVALTGLTADTLYRLTVHAQDAAGNAQATAPQSVRTLALSADVTAPTVTISQPAAGALVAGVVAIAATATDAVGVVSVQIRIDGTALGAAQTAPPYGANWTSTSVADGVHTITVEARDAANNVGTASVTVTVQNTPVVLTPHYVDFDGINDAGQVPDADGLSFGNGTVDTPLTIEAWIRPDNMTSRGQILGKWGDTTAEYRLYIFSNIIRLDLRDQSAGATTWAYTTLSQASLLGGWHHLAATYDGRGGATAADGITIYIDGVSVPLTRGNHASYVAMENRTAPLQIARESAGWSHYDGGLDEVRLWSVARSATQLQATLNTELTGSETGLRGYWRFNEGSATTVAGDGPADQPMTLLNGALWLGGGPW